MKKKNLKSLSLNKKSVSNLQKQKMTGGNNQDELGGGITIFNTCEICPSEFCETWICETWWGCSDLCPA